MERVNVGIFLHRRLKDILDFIHEHDGVELVYGSKKKSCGYFLTKNQLEHYGVKIDFDNMPVINRQLLSVNDEKIPLYQRYPRGAYVSTRNYSDFIYVPTLEGATNFRP